MTLFRLGQNGRVRFELFCTIEEAAGRRSRKLLQRPKIVSHSDYKKFQKFGRITQTGSQVG